MRYRTAVGPAHEAIDKAFKYWCVVQLHGLFERAKLKPEVTAWLRETDRFVECYCQCVNISRVVLDDLFKEFDSVNRVKCDPRDLWFSQAITLGELLTGDHLATSDVRQTLFLSLMSQEQVVESARVFDMMMEDHLPSHDKQRSDRGPEGRRDLGAIDQSA